MKKILIFLALILNMVPLCIERGSLTTPGGVYAGDKTGGTEQTVHPWCTFTNTGNECTEDGAHEYHTSDNCAHWGFICCCGKTRWDCDIAHYTGDLKHCKGTDDVCCCGDPDCTVKPTNLLDIHCKCTCCGGYSCPGDYCYSKGKYKSDCGVDNECPCCGGTTCTADYCFTKNMSLQDCAAGECPCCHQYGTCTGGWCSNLSESQDDCGSGNTVVDCAGVAGGSAYIDGCGTCVGGNTGQLPCTPSVDCAGVVGGIAFTDACGNCVGGTTGLQPCVQTTDCAGVIGGLAYTDACGNCVGGATGLQPCNTSNTDCAGVLGGTAYTDACGTCIGGTTGLQPCSTSTADCAGVLGGSAYTDACGNCVAGTTGQQPCTTIKDCAGVIGGSAYIDGCNKCVGGTTELQPCSIGQEELPLPKTEKFLIPLTVKDSCESKSKNNALLVDNIMKNPVLTKPINELLSAAKAAVPIEKSLNMIKKADGTYKTSEVRTDNLKSNVAPPTLLLPVLDATGKYVWADKDVANLHDHPSGWPPSPNDIYSLLERNTSIDSNFPYINHQHYADNIIIGADTTAYAVHVESPNKAASFYKNFSFKSNVGSNGKFLDESPAGKMFKKAQAYFINSMNFSSKQAFAWATAYVLDNSKSGVKLQVRDKNGYFCEINAYMKEEKVINPDGTVTIVPKFTATICNH